MTVGLRRGAWLLAVTLALLTGCASPPRPAADRATPGLWTGRMALQVQDQPSLSFSAGFELRGDARSGQLSLFTPLGSTLALLSWAPGLATLRSNGQTREFDSLEALAQQATGTALPVAVLFDWLAGANTTVPGWQADLSQLDQGRLHARRNDPPPVADLRLALDR